jgi:hypothetical protein
LGAALAIAIENLFVAKKISRQALKHLAAGHGQTSSQESVAA